MKKNHDIIELDCVVRHETEAAYLIETGVGKSQWVPKRFVEVERGSRIQDPATIQIPEWLALEKGFI